MDDTSGSAFPGHVSDGCQQYWRGLNRRELFAAMAMQGFCGSPLWDRVPLDEIARTAVVQADALLDALYSVPLSKTKE